MPAWVVPAIYAGVAVAGLAATAYGVQQQQQAASDARKANQVNRQGQDYELRRARVREFAQARRQRAAAVALANAAGVNDAGSSIVGGVNSVVSQTAGNQAFIGGQRIFARKEGQYLDNVSRARTRASAAGAFGNVAGSLGDAGIAGYKAYYGV